MDFNLDFFIQNAIQSGKYLSVNEIPELSINSTVSIDGINKLKNLKKVRICRMFNDEYEFPGFIDYSCLNNISSLEELYIIENGNIQYLDLSNLKSLTTLVLIFNSNLKEIVGLENLINLKKVIIVGNEFNFIDNMDKFLFNTLNTKINVLGVEFYHRSIGQKQLYNQYKMLFQSKKTNLMFAENTSVGGLYFYSPSMINNIYKKSLKILSSILDNCTDEIEVIKRIYSYVVSNVQYDYDGLAKRDDELYNHFCFKPLENDNKYREINTSYNAIQRKKAVCEGYSNMINFLLGIIGIKSETIICKLKNDNSDYLNHNANKIFINGDWYYCDAQKENNFDSLRYFCKTKDEFLKTHNLSIKDLKTIIKDDKYEKNIRTNA